MQIENKSGLHWYPLPDPRFRRHGLPACSHGYSRLPAVARTTVPQAVAEQSQYAAGVRLRFATNSSRLILRCQALSKSKGHGIDCLVDGVYWKTLLLARGDMNDVMVFRDLPARMRSIELYLPHEQEVDVCAVGLQSGADIASASPYRDDLPLVFYGSSIVQGAGVNLSCMSYPAVIARALNSDFINWGFYGAGRGEPEVVALVAGCPAKAFILDLGKSYGLQPVDVYSKMLKQLRQAQPGVPLVVITPVFSSRECFDAGFRLRTERTRQIMRDAATVLEDVLLIEGETLLGEHDWTGLSPDGLHPNEKGCAETAKRLLPVIEQLYC